MEQILCGTKCSLDFKNNFSGTINDFLTFYWFSDFADSADFADFADFAIPIVNFVYFL